MPSPFTLCPKCHTPSTDTWMRLYTGDYTGRVWGGTCADKRHGKWAESSPCTRRETDAI